MDTTAFSDLLPVLGTLLLRLVAALIVLFIGWLIARWLGNLTTKILHRFNVDEKTVLLDVGDNLKLGIGYNFTDFSDDLTDLSFDQSGFFLNVTGTL